MQSSVRETYFIVGDLRSHPPGVHNVLASRWAAFDRLAYTQIDAIFTHREGIYADEYRHRRSVDGRGHEEQWFAHQTGCRGSRAEASYSNALAGLDQEAPGQSKVGGGSGAFEAWSNGELIHGDHRYDGVDRLSEGNYH